MTIKSFVKKGVALSQSNVCRTHSNNASSAAQQAISSFQSVKSKKGDQKIDSLADGLISLTKAINEISKSISPIATMNMISSLLSENIQELLEENRVSLLKEINKK